LNARKLRKVSALEAVDPVFDAVEIYQPLAEYVQRIRTGLCIGAGHPCDESRKTVRKKGRGVRQIMTDAPISRFC
jgi:hypothetical protein